MRNVSSPPGLVRRWSLLPAVSATVIAALLSGCASNESSPTTRSGPDITASPRSGQDTSGSDDSSSSAETTAAASAETIAGAPSQTQGPATTYATAPETVAAAADANNGVSKQAGAASPSRNAERPAATPPPAGASTPAPGGDWFEPAPPPLPPVTQPPATRPNIESRDAGVNPTVDARVDPLSTFALDVDTSSYTISRALVQSGSLPDYSTVRTEEFVNYFDQQYASPKSGETFAVHVDGTGAPFLQSNQRIVRVGVQAERVDSASRPPAHLTFVIDTSGSMREDGKLEMVKESLRTLVDNLRADDLIAIVSFSDTAEVVLGATPAKQRQTILNAIDQLTPTNSTNAEAGLILGYQLADQMRTNSAQSGSAPNIDRVILASDGVANVGPTGPEAILARIKEATTKGIDLVTIGVGTTSYNDTMMERLADGGDGFSAYIDSQAAGDRLFRDRRLVSTLQTVARDAKIQVEFDPRVVATYRLLGFENRTVADSQFRNNKVDAGEIGAGHSVTALYEVTFVSERDMNASIGTVNLRWDDIRDKHIRELKTRMDGGRFVDRLSDADPRLGLDVTVAAYAEVLRQAPWSRVTNLNELARQSRALQERLGQDEDVVEFIELLNRAAGIHN
jgi:Ca-activated chloride channel homolog